jgi:hypothetical protein
MSQIWDINIGLEAVHLPEELRGTAWGSLHFCGSAEACIRQHCFPRQAGNRAFHSRFAPHAPPAAGALVRMGTSVSPLERPAWFGSFPIG